MKKKIVGAFAALAAAAFVLTPAGAGAGTPAADKAAALVAEANDQRARKAPPAGGPSYQQDQFGSDARGDADDPRGDILNIGVGNQTGDSLVVVSLQAAQADSFGSTQWRTGLTGIIWDLDTNGDRAADYQVMMVATDAGPVSEVQRPNSTDAICSSTSNNSGAFYGSVFPASCIGSPASLATRAFMSYDTSPSCASCPTSSDLTDWTAPAARGGSSGTPAPAPQPQPAPQPAPPPSGGPGYWFVAADGGVFAYNAPFHGSAAGRIDSPVVGMAAHPTQSGYWLVNSTGRIYNFGAAGHHGDMGGRRLNSPIVDITPTPSGNGYYLLGKDGGIFTFGDAAFHGSTGGTRLNEPVVGMASSRG